MEKQPRLRPVQAVLMADLARRGAEMYHPPLTAVQARKIGQMSITDGVPVVREAPPPEYPDAVA